MNTGVKAGLGISQQFLIGFFNQQQKLPATLVHWLSQADFITGTGIPPGQYAVIRRNSIGERQHNQRAEVMLFTASQFMVVISAIIALCPDAITAGKFDLVL